MVKNFYELKVWQDAHNLTLVIYKTTKDLSYFSSAKGEQFFSDIDLIIKEINGLIAAMNKNSNPSP